MVVLCWRAMLFDNAKPTTLGSLAAAYVNGWARSHMPLHIIYGQKTEEGMGIGTRDCRDGMNRERSLCKKAT
jgi:hypothetical protein